MKGYFMAHQHRPAPRSSAATLAGMGRSIAPAAPVLAQLTEGLTLEQLVERMGAALVSQSGVTVSTDSARRFAAVNACVRVLSDDIAMLPLGINDVSGDSTRPAYDLPLYRLLHDAPNEHMNAFQFRKILSSDMLYSGNGLALNVWGYGNRVVEMHRLHPRRTEMDQDPVTGEVTYRYTRSNGSQMLLRRRDVFHIWKDSDDGVRGLNPIALHRETIGDGLALREHGSRFFSNGAKPGGVLEMPAGGTLKGDTSSSDIRADFEELYSGPANAHRVALLPGGITYKAISISMEDAQFIEGRKYNRSEIAGIFGVPPHKIGDLDKATFSNIEHQALDYVISSLMPWLVCWEKAINQQLTPDPLRYQAKFNVSALLRGDAKSRAEALQIQRRNGVISANEWRMLEDMNRRTDPGGDVYIVEGNMQANDGQTGQRAAGSNPPPAAE